MGGLDWDIYVQSSYLYTKPYSTRFINNGNLTCTVCMKYMQPGNNQFFAISGGGCSTPKITSQRWEIDPGSTAVCSSRKERGNAAGKPQKEHKNNPLETGAMMSLFVLLSARPPPFSPHIHIIAYRIVLFFLFYRPRQQQKIKQNNNKNKTQNKTQQNKKWGLSCLPKNNNNINNNFLPQAILLYERMTAKKTKKSEKNENRKQNKSRLSSSYFTRCSVLLLLFRP